MEPTIFNLNLQILSCAKADEYKQKLLDACSQFNYHSNGKESIEQLENTFQRLKRKFENGKQ